MLPYHSPLGGEIQVNNCLVKEKSLEKRLTLTFYCDTIITMIVMYEMIIIHKQFATIPFVKAARTRD